MLENTGSHKCHSYKCGTDCRFMQNKYSKMTKQHTDSLKVANKKTTT